MQKCVSVVSVEYCSTPRILCFVFAAIKPPLPLHVGFEMFTKQICHNLQFLKQYSLHFGLVEKNLCFSLALQLSAYNCHLKAYVILQARSGDSLWNAETYHTCMRINLEIKFPNRMHSYRYLFHHDSPR